MRHVSEMAKGTGRAWMGFAVSLGAALVACTQAPPRAPPPEARFAAPLEQLPAAPHPVQKPAPPHAVAALPQPPAARPETMDELQGLDQPAALRLLGEPQQRAESPPAVLWRYQGRGCELDLYFYLDLQSRQMRVLHYEVRVTDGSERTQQGCYGELVADRRAAARGADRPR
ncbi:MAG: hypothetical protein ACREFQ_09870 [Stellaceae bacterium]